MRQIGAIAIGTLITLSLALHSTPRASASTCAPYQILYARGSGQVLGSEPEKKALHQHLSEYMPAPVNIVELSAHDMPNNLGLDYPATGVTNGVKEANDGFTAVATRGHIGAYSRSVSQGKELLLHYLDNSNFRICNTRLVFAGYSQGAHVITDTLSDPRAEKYLPLVSFVATFGDPSLDLKTVLGGDVFAETPWYRGDTIKYISGGIVNVRSPYIPSAIQERVGAWCDMNDMICTGNPLKWFNELVNKPHSKYPEKAIPEAAAEIATRLRADLAMGYQSPACGVMEQDFVLAINRSPTMVTDANFLSDTGINKTLDSLFGAACDVRVGVVTFGRDGHEPTAKLIDFTDNRATVAQALESLRSDAPREYVVEKTNITSGIRMALDFPWRQEAGKAIVLLSDGPGTDLVTTRNGEVVDRQSYADSPAVKEVLELSRAKGGVEVYAARVYHPWSEPYQEVSYFFNLYEYIDWLVAETGGRVMERYGYCGAYCNWHEMNLNFSEVLSGRPKLAVASVKVKAGTKFSLNVRDISGGLLTSLKQQTSGIDYVWRHGCQNGEYVDKFDVTGYSFRVNTPQTCYGAVMMLTQPFGYCNVCYDAGRNNIRQLIPFKIEVSPSFEATPDPIGPIINLTKRWLDEETLQYEWGAPEGVAESMVYVVRDESGAMFAMTRARILRITDVARTGDPSLTVEAVGEGSGGTPIDTSTAEEVISPADEVSTEGLPESEEGGINHEPVQKRPRSARVGVSAQGLTNASVDQLAIGQVLGDSNLNIDAAHTAPNILSSHGAIKTADTKGDSQGQELPVYSAVGATIIGLVLLGIAGTIIGRRKKLRI